MSVATAWRLKEDYKETSGVRSDVTRNVLVHLGTYTLTKLTLPHDANSVVPNKEGKPTQNKKGKPQNTHKGIGHLTRHWLHCRI